MKRNALVTVISLGLSLLSITETPAAETSDDAEEMWALAQERLRVTMGEPGVHVRA